VKKRVAAVFLVVIICAVAYWGYAIYFKPDPHTGLVATGTVEATQVELRAKLSGTLQDLNIAAGDQVQKGQLIAIISRNDLVAQRERDSLSVQKARALLADLTSGAREQEIRDAEIGVSTAQINYDKALKDYDRGAALFEENVISESEIEGLEYKLNLNKNLLDSAQSRLSLLLSGSRPEQIEAAKVELERNIAVLKASESLLEDAKITCPIEGTVLTKNIEDGEVIQTGASVATIADLSNMWIKVYIPTDDLPLVRLGQAVTFTVSGFSAEFQGTVEEIAKKGEFTPKTIQTKKERTNVVYPVKIKVNDSDGLLKPGMPADVVIRYEAAQ